MANTLLTISQITRKALMVLHQKANFLGAMNRGYDDSFAKSGAKIGDTLRIRLPNEYVVRSGMTMNSQDTVEQSVPLVVNNVKGVDMNFTSQDLTLSLDDFSDRIIDPALSTLVANVEYDVFQGLYKQVYNIVDQDAGAFGFSTLSAAREVLANNLAPPTKRSAILKPNHATKFMNDTKGLFNAQENISEQFREGALGRTQGANVWENTNFTDHLTGTAAKTTGYVVNGGSQGGAAITVQTGTTTFKKGDIVTFVGANAVNPETKADLGYLKTFVITADTSTSATSLAISPSIVTSGARQNVTASPTAGGAVVKVGAGASELLTSSLEFYRDAFTFATADLVMPDGQDQAFRAEKDGISISVVRGFNIIDRSFPCRLDILYGYAATRPQLAVRMHADG